MDVVPEWYNRCWHHSCDAAGVLWWQWRMAEFSWWTVVVVVVVEIVIPTCCKRLIQSTALMHHHHHHSPDFQ
jgi:hypothetical protein